MRTDILASKETTLPSPCAAHGVDCAALSLGRIADRALHAESSWEVAAVFRRSFYCRAGMGSLVCFGPMALGDGPINIRLEIPRPIDWEAAGLAPGSAATSDGRVVLVGGRVRISLSGASAWRPSRPVVPWHPDAVLARVFGLADEIRVCPPRGGLHALIPALAAETGRLCKTASSAPPLLRLAAGGIQPLATWLEARLLQSRAPLPVPTRAIESLIGLGPGLTPSGDDLLGGVLVALHHLDAPDVAGDLAREVLPRAAERTNAISHAHLAAAAEGEGLAPLHAVLSDLTDPDGADPSRHLPAIDAIGHSSGWDALAGIVLAVTATARSRADWDGARIVL